MAIASRPGIGNRLLCLGPSLDDAASAHLTFWTIFCRFPRETASDEYDTLKRIGSTEHDALSTNALIKLFTYETRLLRQVERLVAQLAKLRLGRDAGGSIQGQISGSGKELLVLNNEVLSSLTASQ